jgi:putative ABC transport system permease protein
MGVVVPLARRNLLAEKVRFSMSVAGVAFAVLLVLVIASLYRGWSKSSAFFGELPGEIWVAQQGTSDPLRASSHLPSAGLTKLEQIDGVAMVLPVYTRRIAIPTPGLELSVQFMSFVAPPGVPISDEDRSRFFPRSGSIIIDRVFADKADLSVGSAVRVVDTDLLVEHITPGGNPLFELAFVNGTDAPDLLGLPGYVSFFVLVLKPNVSIDGVTRAVAETLPGAEARTSAQYAKAMSDTVDEGFLPVVGALVAIGLIIGGAVVALTTYTATIEKARDFAVLKALGASAWFVYRIVIRQSALVGVLGSAIGVVSAALVSTLVRRVVPEFVTDMRWPDSLGVFATTVLVSLVAAYIPVRRINRIDPAMVFRA